MKKICLSYVSLKFNVTCLVYLETLGPLVGMKTVSLSQANPERDRSGFILRLILYQ